MPAKAVTQQKKKALVVWKGHKDLRKNLVAIEDLYTDPANARKHGERNADQVRSSLKEFGQQNVLMVTNEGKVLVGNLRLQEAKKMGWTHIAALRFESEDAARQAAFAIVDNRTGELAEWDERVLVDQLKALEESFDLDELVGFTGAEVTALMKKLEDEKGGGGAAARSGTEGCPLGATDCPRGRVDHG